MADEEHGSNDAMVEMRESLLGMWGGVGVQKINSSHQCMVEAAAEVGHKALSSSCIPVTLEYRRTILYHGICEESKRLKKVKTQCMYGRRRDMERLLVFVLRFVYGNEFQPEELYADEFERVRGTVLSALDGIVLRYRDDLLKELAERPVGIGEQVSTTLASYWSTTSKYMQQWYSSSSIAGDADDGSSASGSHLVFRANRQNVDSIPPEQWQEIRFAFGLDDSLLRAMLKSRVLNSCSITVDGRVWTSPRSHEVKFDQLVDMWSTYVLDVAKIGKDTMKKILVHLPKIYQHLPCVLGRHISKGTVGLTASQTEALRRFKTDVLDTNRRGCVVTHQMGTGKTILALSMVREAVMHLKSLPFETMVAVPGSWTPLAGNAKVAPTRWRGGKYVGRDDKEVVPLHSMFESDENAYVKRVVIVVPPGLMFVWAAEVRKLCIGAGNENRHQESANFSVFLDKHMVVEIYSYQEFARTLADYPDLVRDVVVIFDEAHRLEVERRRIGKTVGNSLTYGPFDWQKTFRTEQASASVDPYLVALQFSDLYNALRSSSVLVLLTGTPMYFDTYDLVGLVNLVADDEDMLPWDEAEYNEVMGEIPWNEIVFTKYVGAAYNNTVINSVVETLKQRSGFGVGGVAKSVLDAGSAMSAMGVSAAFVPSMTPVLVGTIGMVFMLYAWNRAGGKTRTQKTYKHLMYQMNPQSSQLQCLLSKYFFYHTAEADPTEAKWMPIETEKPPFRVSYNQAQVMFHAAWGLGLMNPNWLRIISERLQEDQERGGGGLEYKRGAAEGPGGDTAKVVVSYEELFARDIGMWNRLQDLESRMSIGNLVVPANSTNGVGKEIGGHEIVLWPPKFEHMLAQLSPRSMIYSSFYDHGVVNFLAYLAAHEDQLVAKGFPNGLDDVRLISDPNTDQETSWTTVVEASLRSVAISAETIAAVKRTVYKSFEEASKDFNSGHTMDRSQASRAPASLILFHPDVTEGVSLLCCKRVVLMEPILESARKSQVVARAKRFKSHATNCTKGCLGKVRNVCVEQYVCTVSIDESSGYFDSLVNRLQPFIGGVVLPWDKNKSTATIRDVAKRAIDGARIVGSTAGMGLLSDFSWLQTQDEVVYAASELSKANQNRLASMLSEHAIDRRNPNNPPLERTCK